MSSSSSSSSSSRTTRTSSFSGCVSPKANSEMAANDQRGGKRKDPLDLTLGIPHLHRRPRRIRRHRHFPSMRVPPLATTMAARRRLHRRRTRNRLSGTNRILSPTSTGCSHGGYGCTTRWRRGSRLGQGSGDGRRERRESSTIRSNGGRTKGRGKKRRKISTRKKMC